MQLLHHHTHHDLFPSAAPPAVPPTVPVAVAVPTLNSRPQLRPPTSMWPAMMATVPMPHSAASLSVLLPAQVHIQQPPQQQQQQQQASAAAGSSKPPMRASKAAVRGLNMPLAAVVWV
jgi:hypothetical protein